MSDDALPKSMLSYEYSPEEKELGTYAEKRLLCAFQSNFSSSYQIKTIEKSIFCLQGEICISVTRKDLTHHPQFNLVEEYIQNFLLKLWNLVYKKILLQWIRMKLSVSMFIGRNYCVVIFRVPNL